MSKLYTSLLFSLLLIGTSTFAQKAVYNFCVNSQKMQTFKAQVTFKSIDFGSTAARQMVYNEIVNALGNEVKINTYNENCDCYSSCPLLEVYSKDWDGNMGDSAMSTSSILGSLAEMTDKIVSESKAIFTDPGGFLKRNFFSGSAK